MMIKTIDLKENQIIQKPVQKLVEKLAAAVDIILEKDGNQNLNSELVLTQLNVQEMNNEESSIEINHEPKKNRKQK